MYISVYHILQFKAVGTDVVRRQKT